jgi:putative ABC transport system permease protein
MGLFRREKKEVDAQPTKTEVVQVKSPEEIQKERIANELEYLQGELKSKTEHLDSISEKLGKAKEEYDGIICTLMASKKEINENRAMYEQILQKISTSESQLNSVQRQIDEKKALLDELRNAKAALDSAKAEYLKYKAESEKLKSAHDSYEEIRKSQEAARKELEETKKEYESKKKEIEIVKKELKFIENQLANATERSTPKNVVAAASSVVSSLNSKLLATQKELETLKIALQREREEHQETKSKLK